MKKVTDFKKAKNQEKKISMVTCYDHWSAKILADTEVDCLLVGDSVAMVVHGFDSTVHATTEMIATHTAAVARANTGKLIVSDLPFLAHQKGKKELFKSVDKLMKAGANAIKIEAAPGHHKVVKTLSEAGIPMIGHLGLTPQYVHQFGGYKIQGKTDSDYKKILNHGIELENAGCHAMVLECVPNALAKELTETLSIPTIGIGAGLEVNGQVLVLQDLLGFSKDFKPKFVRHFAHGEEWMTSALNEFSLAVEEKLFPNEQETFQ